MARFLKRTLLPVSAEAAYDWHARPGALERLSPPFVATRVLRKTGGIEPGSEVELSVPLGPFRTRWVARHGAARPGVEFCDEQVSGPFRRWRHVHRFEARSASECVLEDAIEFELPGGFLGRAIGEPMARRQIERTFTFRHQITASDLRRHAQASPAMPLRIVVSGASGLVGSALLPFLSTAGHTPVKLVRPPKTSGKDAVLWDPSKSQIDRAALEGADAVVHLAGENIAARRWSPAVKAEIERSRVQSTKLLAETIASLERPPKVFVCASAIGFYGERGDEVLDESSRAGTGFLADVCQKWESAAQPAAARGIRTVHLRFGVILSGRGGALAKMLTPFKLGAGGRVGSGRQWMSWVALEDVIGSILFAVTQPVSGPANVVSPNPVTNAEFTKVLGKVLSRPTIFPMPAPIVRIAFGELGDALLLGSQRVLPKALQRGGFRFLYPDLEAALRFELGR